MCMLKGISFFFLSFFVVCRENNRYKEKKGSVIRVRMYELRLQIQGRMEYIIEREREIDLRSLIGKVLQRHR